MHQEITDNSLFTDHFHEFTREDLLKRARKEKFFHNMAVAGIETGSWVYKDNLPQNYHLFPAFQYLNELLLDGAICLDIGSYDGHLKRDGKTYFTIPAC